MSETIEVTTDTTPFYEGCRICIGPQPRWYVRIWRWLSKRNYRVARIEGSTLTMERCR